ncbi:MAG: metallophosphoesterase [Thermoleophilia bacterium]
MPFPRRSALLLAVAAAGLGAAACGDAPPDVLARGPYLTEVTETTARLRWIARDGARIEIEAVGPDGARVVAGDGELTGLSPGTRYEWTARAGGDAVAEGAVTTAPQDLTEPLEFLVFGDYGAPNDTSAQVAALAEAQRPRLLVTTGDNGYLVTLPELLDQNIFGPLRAVLAQAPNYGVVGDHDVFFPAGQAALVEALDWPGDGERYDRDYGPVQIVGLGLNADPGDVAFARRALARPGPRARFVVLHQPIREGSPMLPVIAAADVTAVLEGHLHAYERRERPEAPGVPFLTVGTGGAPRSDRTPTSADARVHIAEFGLMRVRLQGDRAAFEFVDVTGRVRDRIETRNPAGGG